MAIRRWRLLACGSWLANPNLLLPCWAITAIVTTALLRALGIVIVQSVFHVAISVFNQVALIGALAFQFIGRVWYAHRISGARPPIPDENSGACIQLMAF
jgi:hypothetical protein